MADQWLPGEHAQRRQRNINAGIMWWDGRGVSDRCPLARSRARNCGATRVAPHATAAWPIRRALTRGQCVDKAWQTGFSEAECCRSSSAHDFQCAFRLDVATLSEEVQRTVVKMALEVATFLHSKVPQRAETVAHRTAVARKHLAACRRCISSRYTGPQIGAELGGRETGTDLPAAFVACAETMPQRQPGAS